MLFLAWKHSGADPYALYNSLDADYRPLGGGGDRRPPPFPWRLRMFIYGCASLAEKDATERAVAAAAGGMKRGMGA